MKRKANLHTFAWVGVLVLLVASTGITTQGGVTEGINDAAFVMQNVPTTMTAGQTYSVSVSMLNTGTSTWTGGAGYALGSINPLDNTTWAVNRIGIPKGRATSPGNIRTFVFTVIAPTTSGLYDFQWQMLRNSDETGLAYFGEPTPNTPINVVGGTGGNNDAAFVTQTVPTPMLIANVYTVSIQMRNTGTTTWTGAGGYALASQSPPNNMTWGVNRVPFSGAVAPNEVATFTFQVTAPATPGVYDFQWEMIQEGVDFFGALSTNVSINVTSGIGTNNAHFVSQTVPATLTTGQAFGVTIVMVNTGSTTWTAATGYALGSQNPTDNTTWGPNRVALPNSVDPGGSVSFAFNMTAPAVAGTYNFQWRMVQEGVEFFGEPTTNVPIVVSTGGTGDTGFGNNLSVPVIFSDSHGLTGNYTHVDTGLRPTVDETPPTFPYFDPDYTFILNGTTYYPQKTPSTWCAQWQNGSVSEMTSAVVNWSDNILNKKWTPKSVIRVENILYQTGPSELKAYEMSLLGGQGTTESWGTTGNTVASMYRTVYTTTARLKIEKIDRPGGTVVPNVCGFNGAVWEKYGVDGPGGYGAEVNVSGNLIFGFNWKLNECTATTAQKLGWWRLTFSFDPMARYVLNGVPHFVECNVRMDALDPGDLLGRFYVPRLQSPSESVLEIEIVRGQAGTGE